MAASDTHNNNKKRSNRRRKKRRTEDFSSSNESSSSSSSESDHEDLDEPEKEILKQDINIDDIDIESDNENSALTNDKGNKLIPQNLSITEKQQLSTVPFTTTSISNITNDNQIKNIPNINEISKNLDQKKTQLNNEFLKIMTTEFGDDLDELRKKPDFTEKSLVILAKTLQLGVNMFDIDVLNGLIQESGNTSNQ